MRAYGLTWDEVKSLISAQRGHCPLCGVRLADLDATRGIRGKDKPHVDHSHHTGVVRGVLCNRCNNGLGFFDDDPERLVLAATYVQSEGKFNGDDSLWTPGVGTGLL
jgi:hypothetical protein